MQSAFAKQSTTPDSLLHMSCLAFKSQSFVTFILLWKRKAGVSIKRCPWSSWTAEFQLKPHKRLVRWSMKKTNRSSIIGSQVFLPSYPGQNVPFIDLKARGSRIQGRCFFLSWEWSLLSQRTMKTQISTLGSRSLKIDRLNIFQYWKHWNTFLNLVTHWGFVPKCERAKEQNFSFGCCQKKI